MKSSGNTSCTTWMISKRTSLNDTSSACSAHCGLGFTTLPFEASGQMHDDISTWALSRPNVVCLATVKRSCDEVSDIPGSDTTHRSKAAQHWFNLSLRLVPLSINSFSPWLAIVASNWSTPQVLVLPACASACKAAFKEPRRFCRVQCVQETGDQDYLEYSEYSIFKN